MWQRVALLRVGKVKMSEASELCKRLEAPLSEYVCEGAAGVDASERQILEAHLQRCPHCQKVLAAWQSVQKRLRLLIPPTEEIGAGDVPEYVVQRTRQGIFGRINQRTTASPSPRADAGCEHKRDYRLIVSWACAVAAGLCLVVGAGLFWSSKNNSKQSTDGAAVQRAPTSRSVTELRQEFDQIVQKDASRQISVGEFSQKVQAIIAESHALLPREDLPEANAIHVMKLIADGYGVLAEHQNEFAAYLAFAERLSCFYAEHPYEFKDREYVWATTGEHVVLEALLNRAQDCQRVGRYLSAVRYYDEIRRRSPRSSIAAYSLYSTAECYMAYDLPDNVALCQAELLREYPDSNWVIPLLQKEANALYHQMNGKKRAADIYLRISSISKHRQESFLAKLAAVGILIHAKEFARADVLLSEVVTMADGDKERQLAWQLRSYALLSEAGEVKGLIGAAMK